MAPPLPSRILTTVRSHGRASWFLLAALVPFFLPFLILCMPILLLLLPPVSFFLFFLLLLYKVKAFLSEKLKGGQGRADKGVGYQASQRIAAAEGLDNYQQVPREEVKGLDGANVQSPALEEVKGVEDPDVQSVESHIYDKEEDEVDSCMLPSRVCEFEQEKLGLPVERFAVQDDRAEEKREGRQLEQDPSVEEGLERSRQGWSPEYEEPKLLDVQNVQLPSFIEAQGEEGLQRPERVRDFTEDTGKELPQKERMQDDKQEEEQATQESIYLKEEQKQAEEESDFTEGTPEDKQELPLKDRMQDDKQVKDEATQELIDLTDQQKQPERESDKEEEEEAILDSIHLKDQQKQPERESDFMEGILEPMGKELPHIDKMEDDTQVKEEATQESIDLKSENGQHEKESKFAEETPEDTRKELPHMVWMEDDKQEEGETSQELINLNNKQRQPEKESEFFEGTLEDVEKELLQKDRMEDTKQVEEEAIQKTSDSKDKQDQPSLHVDPTSSHTSEEFRSLADELESFDKPYSGDHQSSVRADWEGPESTEDFSEKQESSHVHQFEEASNRLPSIEAELAAFSEQIVEKPREELREQFAIDTPATFEHTTEEPELSSILPTHEHTREEPEFSSKEDSSLEIFNNRGGLDKEEDIIAPAEPFEKQPVEGEPSYRFPESHGQLRWEPFAEETKEDEQPQTGKSTQDLATSFEAEAASEREEGYPSEGTSSAVPSPHESHEGMEFQDRIREEQKIIADISTIKKIVGYQGEPNASILEQIRALYLFLGMEPYDWAAEVDDLERMQAEIELLKVVVGVK